MITEITCNKNNNNCSHLPGDYARLLAKDILTHFNPRV